MFFLIVILCIASTDFRLISRLCLAHQVFKERRDLSCEDSQVQEAGGDLIIVLSQVTVPQILQNLYVLILILHMIWEQKKIKTDHSFMISFTSIMCVVKKVHIGRKKVLL